MSVAPKIRVGRLFRMRYLHGFVLCRISKIYKNGWFSYEKWDESVWRPIRGFVSPEDNSSVIFEPDAKEMLLERLKRDR